MKPPLRRALRPRRARDPDAKQGPNVVQRERMPEQDARKVDLLIELLFRVYNGDGPNPAPVRNLRTMTFEFVDGGVIGKIGCRGQYDVSVNLQYKDLEDDEVLRNQEG